MAMTEQTMSVRDGMFSTQLLRGGDGPPLVYLHAAGGLRAGSPWIEALTRDFTVYAPWHPGFGQSEGLEGIDDVHDLAVYYLDLFDALGLESPVVVGHSFGGMVAAEVAARCSSAVSRLVLVAPVGLWRDDMPVADIFTMGQKELMTASFGDPNGQFAQMASAMPADPAQQADAMVERMQSLAAAGKFLWPIPDKGLKKRLHRIKAPTLILWGEKDWIIPSAYAEMFRTAIPNARVRTFPEAGHVMPLENMAEFVQAVRDFAGAGEAVGV